MFVREPAADAPPLSHSALMWTGLATATILTILIGFVSDPLLRLLGEAAAAIG